MPTKLQKPDVVTTNTLAIVPPELPPPVVIEVLDALDKDALIMFALHHLPTRERIVQLMDAKFAEHDVTKVTGDSVLRLLEAATERALSSPP